MAEPTYRRVIQVSLDHDIHSEGLAQKVKQTEPNRPEAFFLTAHLASEEDVRVNFFNHVAA